MLPKLFHECCCSFIIYALSNSKVPLFINLFADSVVQETSRISSGVFMVRYVAQDQWFKSVNSGKEYLMRKGDRVAIYPPALHKDPEIFEEPLVSYEELLTYHILSFQNFSSFWIESHTFHSRNEL